MRDDDVEVQPKAKLSLLNDVVGWLIEEMQKTWRDFFEKVDNCSMLFPELNLFFGPISRKQIPQEMELLVQTKTSGSTKHWVKVRFPRRFYRD